MGAAIALTIALTRPWAAVAGPQDMASSIPEGADPGSVVISKVPTMSVQAARSEIGLGFG
jgi:hypothetical protein